MNEPIRVPPVGSITDIIARFISSKLTLFGSAGWVTGAFILQQILRLGTSILLAWLLAPELLGTMVLINTLRTGVELLTDVGLGQSIVSNPRGNEPAFYNTAWTIQIVRGVALTIIALALSIPMAELYDNAALRYLLPWVAPIFIIAGVMSTSRFLLQKRMEVRKVANFDLGVAVAGAAVQIALAAYSPTIWALICGLLLSTAINTVASFYIINWRDHKIMWDKDAAKSILHFGKWIFASTLIYFFATNFDRLYFANAIPIALLGVYGIARTFSETGMMLFQRISNLLIFPKISASALRGADLRRSIGPTRMILILCIAVGLALSIAVADAFIYMIYDERYHAAGFFLTVLLAGTWFSTLATISDSMIMGVGKPSGVAFGNGAKLAIIVTTLPYLLANYGINAALAVFVLAEVVRYVVLMWQKRSQGIGFARQDIISTVIFIILALLFREITMLIGFTGGISDWIIQAQAAHV